MVKGRMTLSQYLKKTKQTPLDFARKLGVDQVTVYRWCNGSRVPREHMQKIAEATGGKVTANDFYSGQR